MDLIPGLPEEIGLQCLIRVPFWEFSSVGSVCKSWKLQIELPEFLQNRKTAGFSQQVIVMAQAQLDPTLNPTIMILKPPSAPLYRLTLCDPATWNWSDLPPIPGYSKGLPMFCQLTGVGSYLVVMGGLDPVTWEASNLVFVYSFISSRWRHGADMPGCPRSFFACASDSNGTVFVGGGHDGAKNALASAMAYNVENDKWVPLPDMARERDECKGVFHGGKFHVIGGYCTLMQGRFETSGEAFDVATWQWDQVDEMFLENATCPRTCLEGGDGKMYICRAGDVAVLENSTWKLVVELPYEVLCSPWMTAWHDKLLVIGCPRFGEPHQCYVLDLKSCKWVKLEARGEYISHVQSGCCFEL